MHFCLLLCLGFFSTSAFAGPKYLGSDLLWISCSPGWRECHIDEDVDGNKIVLGSSTYQKGLYAHAASVIQFSLDGQFDTLHSCIGIDERSDCPPATRQGNARFRVTGDGNVLRDWQRKKGGEDAVCFEISVRGIKLLKLQTDDGGNTYECDHTAWVDTWVDAGCSCSDDTETAHGGKIIGQCVNKLDGKEWCYVKDGEQSKCPDKKPSRRGDKWWSFDACKYYDVYVPIQG